MSANDLPRAVGHRAEHMALLNREAAAIQKMRAVLSAAIAEEYALGVKTCAPLFAACEAILQSAVLEIAHAAYGGEQ